LLVNELRAYAEQLGRFASAAERKEPGPKGTAGHKHKTFGVAFEADADGNPLADSPTLIGCKGCTSVWLAKQVGLAYDPSDRILIQATNQQLVLVAGTANMTLLVKAGHTLASGKAVVSARLFLNAVKSLRGKDEVYVSIDQFGACLEVGTGAKLTLPNVDEVMPRFIRNDVVKGIDLAPHLWLDLAKALDEVAGNFWPFGHISFAASDEAVRFTGMDSYCYLSATHTMSQDSLPLPMRVLGGIPATFVSAARYLDAERVWWGNGKIALQGSNYMAVAKLQVEHPGFPLPLELDVKAGVPTTKVQVAKKVLADIVKGLALNDQYNRMALVTESQTLTLHPYTNDNASMRVPAEVEGGNSRIYVAADLLQKALRVAPGKTVSLWWKPGATAPIRVVGEKPWAMFLAPVAL